MKPIPLRDLRHAVYGKVDQPLPAGADPIRHVCTDTRQMKPDSVFFALRGETFDGHDHVGEAFERGAEVVVVERPPAEVPKHKHVIEVPDTRKALGRLAGFIRDGMRHTKVVAVAGSVGKTGTKALIHAALGAKLPGGASPKSFNNDIGVPLTLFAADASWHYLVLEFGTNHPGEIAHLSRIAKPDIAVITNAAEEHLEFLGSLDGVRHENAQTVVGMDALRGLLVLNGDDPDLRKAVDGWWKGRVLTFGSDDKSDLFATEVTTDWDGTRFRLNGSRVTLHVPMLGKHVATNALAAVAVARRMGLTDEQLATGLSKAVGPEMRLQPMTVGGVRVLNDAYNANPPSVRAALETIAALPCDGRRVIVLGDMFELGATGPGHHYAIGRLAARQADVLVLVGEQMSTQAAEGAKGAGLALAKLHTFPDTAAAAAKLPALVHPGDTVLLKGSRGMRMETLLKGLDVTAAKAG